MRSLQTVDKVRDKTLAFLLKGNHRLTPMPFIRRRQRRIILLFCLFKGYLPWRWLSTLRRAHRKAASELTTISMADKIVAKQEGRSELQAAEGLLR